jgi:hypothetical protein
MGSAITRNADRRKEKAFTVLEVLIALTLLGVVLIATFSVFSSQFRAFMAGRKLANEHQNARLVLEWMGRRIRLAGLGAPAGIRFTQRNSDAVAILADVDGNVIVEEHRYCIDAVEGVVREQIGSGVTYNSCATGSPLTSRGIQPLRVVQLQFAYFNATEGPPVNLQDVTRVRITLALDSNRNDTYDPGSDLTFTMDVRVRNFG